MAAEELILGELLKGKDFEADMAEYELQRKQLPPDPCSLSHPDLPGIPFSDYHSFQNWCGQINVQNLCIFKPLTVDQCVAIANNAAKKGFKVRPVGKMHGWSPLAVGGRKADDDPAKIYFVDMQNIKTFSFAMDGDIPTGTFSTGVKMIEMLEYLENYRGDDHPAGFGLVNTTGPGELTLGGALAIGAHGTSVPYTANPDLQLCGSISNLVRSFKAIVSDPDDPTGRYVEKEFHRSHADAAAFLVHLGRAFLTEVTIQVVPNYFLEVRNYYPTFDELFGPATGANSLQSFVENTGRVEIIYFPFTNHPWVKTWVEKPDFTVNPVHQPYNYPFANRVSPQGSRRIQNLFNGAKGLTPAMMGIFLGVGRDLSRRGRADWIMSGRSKDLLLYVEDSTLRITALGYAIQIRRADIQATANKFMKHFNERLEDSRHNGIFPVNSPVEIRFTSVDDPAPLQIPGAEAPLLSASSPIDPARKELDTIFWVDILTMPETEGVASFFEGFETWIAQQWPGQIRPEWSKGWAFAGEGGWKNDTVLTHRIPKFYSATMEKAKAIYHKYDKSNIYSNWLLNKILP